MFPINPTGCATSNQEAVISAKVMDMGKKRIEGKIEKKLMTGRTYFFPREANTFSKYLEKYIYMVIHTFGQGAMV